MSQTKNQSGFAILEVILVIAGLAIIGFITFRVLSAKQASDPSPTTNQTGTDPSEVKSSADLAVVEKELDKENLDAETVDEVSLDAELANF